MNVKNDDGTTSGKQKPMVTYETGTLESRIDDACHATDYSKALDGIRKVLNATAHFGEFGMKIHRILSGAGK